MNDNDYREFNNNQLNNGQDRNPDGNNNDIIYTGGSYSDRAVNNNANSIQQMSEGTYEGTAQNAEEGSRRYENVNMNYSYGAGSNYQNGNDYQYGTGGNENKAYNGMYSNTYPNDYLGSVQNKKEPKPKKKKEPGKHSPLFKKMGVSIAMGLCFGIFAGISFYAVRAVSDYVAPQTVETGAAGNAASTAALQEAPALNSNSSAIAVVSDVTDVVESVMPSVVSITNKFTENAMDYFGQTTSQEQEAGGSGIIVGENDTELLITTNFHVVEKADKLTVQFIDGTEVEAQLKGNDAGMDLAVIAVQLEDLNESTRNSISIAKLGDSENLKIGEPAIAIGNALGYGQSVTTGIISAVNRSIMDVQSSETPTGIGAKSSTSLIQTDAAINPGNSGGALLNVNGEVIGINSNKIGGSVIEGMGYAIPISTAKPIIEDLMTKTTRLKVAEENKAYLGISGVDVSAEVAGTYGMPEGVYIAQVYAGTAAAEAGLVKGDIITKFDGSSVSSMQQLSGMLQYYTAGTAVDITIQQGSPSGYQEKTLSITLGAKPDEAVR